MISKLFAPLSMRISAGIIAALVLALTFCWLAWDRAAAERDNAQNQLVAANAQVSALQLDLDLRDRAALERAHDAGVSASQAEELIDARSQSLDDPDAARLRALCVKLRQQSPARANTTPACRRSDGETGAGDPG